MVCRFPLKRGVQGGVIKRIVGLMVRALPCHGRIQTGSIPVQSATAHSYIGLVRLFFEQESGVRFPGGRR